MTFFDPNLKLESCNCQNVSIVSNQDLSNVSDGSERSTFHKLTSFVAPIISFRVDNTSFKVCIFWVQLIGPLIFQ